MEGNAEGSGNLSYFPPLSSAIKSVFWFDFFIYHKILEKEAICKHENMKNKIYLKKRMQGSMNLYELVAYREQFSFSKLNLLFPRTEFFFQLKPLNDRNIKK